MLAWLQSLWQLDSDWVVLAFTLILAWSFPRLGDRWLGAIERAGERFAAHKNLAVLAAFLTPILIRVSLLPVFPIRPPGVHDEFSYLLAADTFAHGRLTNPPHPMWIFFDTFHVLQHPTYASMYPPAQGAVLALGQLLGHPWIGLLLSVGAMFAAFLWMLQGWFSPKWALLGAALPLFQFGIFSYWMNSYWGGAVPAFGAALVLGAFPRILRRHRLTDAILFGLGACILANSRPFEGLVFCVPLAIAMGWWLFSRRSPVWRVTFPSIIIPIGCVLLIGVAFILFYNWRVTLNPFVFPHTLDDNLHLSNSSFVWGTSKPLRQYMNHQFDVFYNHFARNQFLHTWDDFGRISWEKVTDFQEFFLGTALLVPLLTFPRVLLDRRMRLAALQFMLCVAVMLTVVYFNPHYAAPAFAAFLCLLVQMFRHLRRWKYHGDAVGIGLTRAVVLLTVAAIPMSVYQAVINPETSYGLGTGGANWQRTEIAAQLNSMDGQHLVIVRYSQTHHNIHQEWVYNAADIDRARIVWAREIPGIDIQPLLDYYKNRKVWLIEPDVYPVPLTPYSAASVPLESAVKIHNSSR